MGNINQPGVFPLVIALFLAIGFWKANQGYKTHGSRSYFYSRMLCGAGAVIYFLIALFELARQWGWLV